MGFRNTLKNAKSRVKFFLDFRHVGAFSRLHVYKTSHDGIEYVIPYGKSKFVQFLHIYNPQQILFSAYKIRYYLSVAKYNAGWITRKEQDKQWAALLKKGYRIFKNDLFRKIQYYFW